MLAIAAVVVVGAAGAYALNAVLGVPKGDRPSAIAKLPEANLVIPGSPYILTRASAKPGYDGAAVTTITGVNAPKVDVFTFYRRELTARGWQGPDSTGYASTVEWAKGHYRFQLESRLGWAIRLFQAKRISSTTFRSAIRYDSALATASTTSP